VACRFKRVCLHRVADAAPESNSQEASNGSEYSVKVEEVGGLDPDNCRDLVTEGLALTVGKYCDRLFHHGSARRGNWASAAATV